jgi:hypothetical protein
MLRRVLITVVVTVAILFAAGYWGFPIALSFYTARKVPRVARIVPVDLKDASVSLATGKKLSYVGYEFEVPWNDLDETHTKLYPAGKPAKTVILAFRSGLRIKVSAIPAHEWNSDPDPEIRAVPRVVGANFGYEAVRSDYSMKKAIYEFTPDRMHYWALEPRMHYREQILLVIKSIMLPESADSGILNIQNQSYRGFQFGDPQIRQARLVFELYSDEDSVEMIFFQKDYKSSTGVTQPEINRIIQTVHKTTPNAAAAPAIAQK